MTFLNSHPLRLILFVIFAGCISSSGSQVGRENSYSFGMFKRAITEDSTSPLFILVGIRDHVSATPRQVCVPAPALLGAIHAEKGLPYDIEGRKMARALALSVWDKPIWFSRRDAREIVKTQYSEGELDQLRTVMHRIRRSDIRARLPEICAGRSSLAHQIRCQYASAHAVLERGILVGIADQTGQLYCP
jgi:hypothetical protein